MIKIAVVAGGYSDEYVISLKSGAFIYDQLDERKYQKYRVEILKEGWFAVLENKKYPIDKEDFSFTKEGEKHCFDVVFNIIHGTPGEDGHLQAYWELIGMPYTGARYYPSALTFNKKDTLSVLNKYGINQAKSIYLKNGDAIDFEVVEKSLGVPFFVKPNESGSSLGVSKVHEESEFEAALELAFAEDQQIIIESEIKGDEVQIGLISVRGEAKAINSTLILSENEFFDYDAKYNGQSQEITPSGIAYEAEKKCFEQAEIIYNILLMSGFARVDFIVQEGEPYFLEINTNPGMSDASIFPQQVAASTYTMSELLDIEVQNALEKQTKWKKK